MLVCSFWYFFFQRNHKVWGVYIETLVMLLTKKARDPVTTVGTQRIPTSLRVEGRCHIRNNQLDLLVDSRAKGKHSSTLCIHRQLQAIKRPVRASSSSFLILPASERHFKEHLPQETNTNHKYIRVLNRSRTEKQCMERSRSPTQQGLFIQGPTKMDLNHSWTDEPLRLVGDCWNVWAESGLNVDSKGSTED